MNLRNIIKPAVNGFLFMLLVSSGSLFITSAMSSTMEGEQGEDGVVQSTTPSSTITIKPSVTTKAVSTKSTPIPTRVVKKVTTTPKPVPTCIVTINGSRYNVQALRRTHSGGDIFKCGTDMTATFKSQHGTNYSLIRKYKI